MALVITLILLSVITFLAVTFLVVSRREKGAVVTMTDQTTARLAADAALESAKAGLLVPMLANTNGQLFDLLVSTNFVNLAGFASGVADPTNVNYDYQNDSGHTPLNTAGLIRQNIANLLYSPRPPVFVQTNSDKTEPLDFRFYLDLNRNRRFDTNGLLPVISSDPANPYYDTNGIPTALFNPPNILSNHFVGDPEWIGILEKSDQPHSSSNRFVARYAFVAVPSGKTLDVNYIHNYAHRFDVNMAALQGDGFARNQGVGTWEINLAAFLADLNTNQWMPSSLLTPYSYNVMSGTANTGPAFDDALSLLRYRYGSRYDTLSNVSALFPIIPPHPFQSDNIDEYSDGPLMNGTVGIDESIPANQDVPSLPWSGADNINHFFTTQDFFDPAKTRIGVGVGIDGVAERLQKAGGGISSYDRYTFYRMLSQLGTDTGTDTRLNLNYVNVDAQGRTVPNLTTNLVSWTNALQFFTNAADRLLRTYTTNWFNAAPASYMFTFYNADVTNYFDLTNVANVAARYTLTNGVPAFGVGNIPVWVSNRFVYTPSVQRVLQMAANIYDATTTNYFPSVFRPVFRKELTNNFNNLYIAGFEEVTSVTSGFGGPISAGDPIFTYFMHLPVEAGWLATNAPANALTNIAQNVYNVPWVIGAKKGLPNFNEFAMQNTIYAARRLEFRHANVRGDPNDTVGNPLRFTNELYSLGVSNTFAMEAWNSYRANFPRNVQMSARNEFAITLSVTNSESTTKWLALRTTNVAVLATNITGITPNIWTGITNDPNGNTVIPPASFIVPLSTSFVFAETNIALSQSAQNQNFENVFADRLFVGGSSASFPVLLIHATLNNRVRYFLMDDASRRILDYVSVSRDEPEVNVTQMLSDGASGQTPDLSDGGQWATNRQAGSTSPTALPIGVLNQILVGIGQISPNSGWNNANNDFPSGFDRQKAIAFFNFNLTGTTNAAYALYRSNVFNAPYVPIRAIYQHVTWQANDPLVHYTLQDLDVGEKVDQLNNVSFQSGSPPLKSIGAVNERYQPWGVPFKGQGQLSANISDFNPANKDPRVYQSDNWEFPTNKLPNIGWLGRVHRGTPWQTVYMKSSDYPTSYFLPLSVNQWAAWTGNTNFFDAGRTFPAQDRTIFDLFTIAINENAGRGQLSVNQSGLAAWSAVLSGVITLSNSASDVVFPNQPAPVDSVVIEPAGYAGSSSQVGRIIRAINDVRATNVALFPDHTFHHAGDVLSVPEFTVGSPFLNFSDPDITTLNGISDAMYERIPQQIMSLLGTGEPRFVIYAYGQALRPAPNSIITSGSFFGMCTNYQVVAEVATRTVMRVEGAPTLGMTNATPRLMIENFNLLGPD